MVNVTRIQYPVGQGCLHVGSIVCPDKQGNGDFHYIYDCGSNDTKALKRSVNAVVKRVPQIDALFVSHLDKDHVNGIETLLDSSVPVNTVFIPHLNVAATVANLLARSTDAALSHSLVEASLDPEGWFGQRGVSRIVRVLPRPSVDDELEEPPEGGEPPYADIVWEPIIAKDGDTDTRPVDVQQMKSGRMLAPGPGGRALDWVLVPHVDPVSQTALATFEREIAKELGISDKQKLASQQLKEALKNTKKCKRLRDCFTRSFGEKHNRVSMSVYSGPKSDPDCRQWTHIVRFPSCFPYFPSTAAGWIGTGDAELKTDTVWDAWRQSYQKFLPNLSTILLPHHGSNCNFNVKLLDSQWLEYCVVSAKDPPQYPHPGVEVIESIALQCKIFHHVSQSPGTLFCERLEARESTCSSS